MNTCTNSFQISKAWWILLSALLCLLILSAAAFAEPPAASAPSTEATTNSATTQPVTPQPTLTIDNLQLQIKHIQDSPSLSEQTRTLIVNLYNQAVQQLQTANQWDAKKATYEQELKTAPERLKAIRDEMSSNTQQPEPVIPDNATSVEIDQILREVQTRLATAQNKRTEWEQEQDRRTNRVKEVPDLIAAARNLLQEPAPSPPAVESEQMGVARLAQNAFLQAHQKALNAEIESYQQELLSYDAQKELLQASIDLESQVILNLEKQVTQIQTLSQNRARQEAEKALAETRRELQSAPEVVRPLIEEREKYGVQTREIQSECKRLDQRIAEINETLNTVKQDFKQVEQKVSKVGLTNAIGQLLRQHKTKLPTLQSGGRELLEIKDELADIQLKDILLSERRSELIDVSRITSGILRKQAGTITPENKEIITKDIEDNVNKLRTGIDRLRYEYNNYFIKLVDLDSKERELNETIEQFDDFVDEKILWIKSARLPTKADIINIPNVIRSLLDPHEWRGVIHSILGTVYANRPESILGFLVTLILWLITPRLKRIIVHASERVSRAASDNMQDTFVTLMATVLLALRWPAIFLLLAWAMYSPYYETEFSIAVGVGLRATAYAMFLFRLFRQIARKDGLAEKHFHWNPEAMKIVRRHEFWVVPIVVPCVFLVSTLSSQYIESPNDVCGRTAFVIIMISCMIFFNKILRPAGPVMRLLLQNYKDSYQFGLRHIIYFFILATLVSLTVATVVGYYYTAMYLCIRLFQTVWLLMILMLFSGLVKRWLFYQTRKRALAESRERAALRQQQQQQQQEGGQQSVDLEGQVIQEEKLDIDVISQQTQKLLSVTLLLMGILGIWIIWAETLPALGMFREVQLWKVSQQITETVEAADGTTHVSDVTKYQYITLSHLGMAVLLAFLTFVAVRNVPGLLEITILERLPIDAGGRFAVTAITRYAMTVGGVVAAFAQLGIGWSQVQWLVAAISVGLGFGLQEIFANLVSGLMLLFERPIRIGDVVTVGDTSGTVMRIRTRATTIKNWDNKELIIPNKEFITGNVVNWTLTDSTVRIVIPVGIAYGSNTRKAEEILLKIAQEHPNILSDPAPRVVFTAFADSSLNFELRIFIGSLDYYLTVFNDLHFFIDDEFRKADIEIAFPQRDIHIRSVPPFLQSSDLARGHGTENTNE